MIKLAEGGALVRDGLGHQVPFDLDRLQDDLWSALHDAGLHEPDLPGDLVDVVRQYIYRSGETALPTLEEVERLVVRLLGDCGMHTPARRFCELRQLGDQPQLGEHVASTAEALADLIAADPFYPTPPGPVLADRVRDTLARLDLVQCSRTLARELARHLWLHDQLHTGGPPAPAITPAPAPAPTPASAIATTGGGEHVGVVNTVDPAAPQPAGSAIVEDVADGYWHIRRTELPAHLPTDLARWFHRDLLRGRGISRLLPAVDLEINLPCLVDTLADVDAVPELVLLPHYHDLCDATARVAEHLHRELQARLPHADGDSLPTRLALRGLAAVTERLAGGPGAAAQALRRDLLAIARDHMDAFANLTLRES